jgi:hypothetical protein
VTRRRFNENLEKGLGLAFFRQVGILGQDITSMQVSERIFQQFELDNAQSKYSYLAVKESPYVLMSNQLLVLYIWLLCILNLAVPILYDAPLT